MDFLPFTLPLSGTEKFCVRMEDEKFTFHGTFTEKNPAMEFKHFIFNIHEHAITVGLQHVEIDIRKLKFLNSTGLKVIIDWINEIKILPNDKRYSITFYCKKTSCWQSSCLSTLKLINNKIIKIIEIN